MTFLTSKTASIFSLILLAGTVTLTAPVKAAVQRLDRVAVVVNDDIIMESEVRKRLVDVTKNLKRQKVTMPPEQEILRQVVEQLIMDSIQLQMGERAGVRIDDNTLNQTMQRIAQQNGLTLEQFKQELQKDGVSYQETRNQIRREMITTRVREGRVGSRIQITEQEIQNLLESEAGKQALQAGYRLGHILLKVPERAKAAEQEEIEALANDLFQQLQSGADFAKLATTHSDGPNAAKGGDMGWRKESQLPSIFSDAAPLLQIGEASAPIRSSNGFHIIKLLDKRGGDSLMVPQTHVRHILIQPSEIRSEDQAQALASELRERILQGESFEELAKTHSADTGSLASGGDLGWMNARDLVPSFREVMEKSELNVLSEPFKSRFGWHILEVLDRRMHDMGAEVQRARAREIIYQRKFEEELQIWLREEREDAYVDIKLY